MAEEKCPFCHVRKHNTDFPWKFKCFIQKHGVDLINSLHIDVVFYQHLIQQEVLKKEVVANIKSKGDEYVQKSELLSALEKCDDSSYDLFIDVLKERNMLQIAEKMRKHFSLPSTPDTDTYFVDCSNADTSAEPVESLLSDWTGKKMEHFNHVSSINTSEEFNLPRKDVPLPAAAHENATADVGSRPTTSVITHVIAASEHRSDCVVGLTVHGDELYIARHSHGQGRIEVYNATNFKFKQYIIVKEHEELSRPWRLWPPVPLLFYDCVQWTEMNGLTSCDSNNCLYVSCCCHGFDHVWCIARVELTDDNKVVEWKLKGDYSPGGLSVNNERNLIVACSRRQSPPKLIEYTTRGELVREIGLRLRDGVMNPHHAIQLNSNKFLVSHGDGEDSLHRVCLVDAKGRVLHSFGNKPGSETGQLSSPQHLAVDRSGFILVADRDNNRIVVLDSTLTWSRDLQIDGGSGVKMPSSLYLDEQRNLLFVGEFNGLDARVVIVKV